MSSTQFRRSTPHHLPHSDPPLDLSAPSHIDPFGMDWLRIALGSRQYSLKVMRSTLLIPADSSEQQRYILATILESCEEVREELETESEPDEEGTVPDGDEVSSDGEGSECEGKKRLNRKLEEKQVNRQNMLDRCEEVEALAKSLQRTLRAGDR